MKEYWEITYQRGVASIPVWGMDTAFELRGLTLAQYTAAVNQLPALAQTRADRERALTAALEAGADLFDRLANLNVRVPGIIAGLIEDHDDLHGQMDRIHAITPGQTEDGDLRRARLVTGLWKDYNAAQAAQTPTRPALTVKVNGAAVTAAQFDTLMADCLAAQQTEATARKEVTDAKTALRARERQVDRDNKRWYAAWMKTYPPGTPEGDNARANVPTEEGVAAPAALEIAQLTPHADRTVTVTYAASGGERAATLELQWKAPGEADFGHSLPVVRAGQVTGPFAALAVVAFRTRASNAASGVVYSAVRQVVIQP